MIVTVFLGQRFLYPIIHVCVFHIPIPPTPNSPSCSVHSCQRSAPSGVGRGSRFSAYRSPPSGWHSPQGLPVGGGGEVGSN